MTPETWKGKSARRVVVITAEMLDRFVALSGDTSPIHVSDEAARARGFKGRVVHGFFLGALVSSVVGTMLPGEDGVLQRESLSFHRPCHVGDEVTVEVVCDEHHESVGALVLKATVKDSEGRLLAKGTVQSGLVPKR